MYASARPTGRSKASSPCASWRRRPRSCWILRRWHKLPSELSNNKDVCARRCSASKRRPHMSGKRPREAPFGNKRKHCCTTKTVKDCGLDFLNLSTDRSVILETSASSSAATWTAQVFVRSWTQMFMSRRKHQRFFRGAVKLERKALSQNNTTRRTVDKAVRWNIRTCRTEFYWPSNL